MIFHLTKSNLFTQEPDNRFAREYGLPRGLWTLLWQRYKLMEYSIPELCELLDIKAHRKLSPKTLGRWIWRSEVYSIAHPLMLKGAQLVNSEVFREYEMELCKEILKNYKSSVHKKSKILP